MKLELFRTYDSRGTNGELLLNGVRVCSTIELPWKMNRPQVSCIPEGIYALKKRYSPRFGHHLHVIAVPGREWILIHAANHAAAELKGCIAPVSVLTGAGRGVASRNALRRLLGLCYPVLERGEAVFLHIQTQSL
jgi:hypothetical protein